MDVEKLKMKQLHLSALFQTTFFLIGCIITLTYSNVSAAETAPQKTLLILGDSLSAGYGITQGKNWTDLLQTTLQQKGKKIHLVNASISGDTTANGLNRLPRALKTYNPNMVLIELGANDGLRGLPPKLIRKNLQALIESSLQAKVKVYLMEIIIPPNYGKRYTDTFRQIYHDLAEQYDLPLLPFLLENIALKPELMQADGLHPNERAQEKISAQMWQTLEPLL
ncbi:arylesterase [sulfur-oxidizing endosymbiont of Gigantopelta aegis]|uniref:arylesterase n=1 Tax=sulfur-oxidizing endosymbiont of Gigantopelta aegis TaxID=2794934 RepID=UPI001FEB5D71|nr:arylesterase [sulfur-oxidizing endosymbiont of Gigantopelta aegis]